MPINLEQPEESIQLSDVVACIHSFIHGSSTTNIQ